MATTVEPETATSAVMIHPAARMPPWSLSTPNSSEHGRNVSQDSVLMPDATPERTVDGVASCINRVRWMPIVTSSRARTTCAPITTTPLGATTRTMPHPLIATAAAADDVPRSRRSHPASRPPRPSADVIPAV
jgi:hypothetical protein